MATVTPAAPVDASRAAARPRRRFPVRRILWVLPFALFLLVEVVLALFASFIAPFDPTQSSLTNRLVAPSFMGGPSQYLLGTDAVGRDVLSRLIVGARASLLVGVLGVIIGSVFGTVAGLVSGFFGGYIDEVITAVGDIQLSFPHVLLAIAVVAVLGSSLTNLILVVGLSGWVTYARVARSVTLRLRSEEFVSAVRALGGGNWRILFRHILPNYAPTLIVLVTLEMPRLILLESTLSFLGLGIQPPTPSWGSIVSDGRSYLDSAWWIAVAPGMVLLFTTLSINRVGDWLRIQLDPALKASA